MSAFARQGAALLVGAALLATPLQALPNGGDDDCVHLTGYGGVGAQGLVQFQARPRALYPGMGAGGAPSGTLESGICAVGNARQNRSTPTKITADFVPINGDDSLGFYCVYGVKASATGGVGGNVGIYLFDLGPGEALVFGSGYGNIVGANLFDAAYDMERVDQVLRFCMGKVPSETRLRIVAPHGHADHINPACNRELERLGYRIAEIAFHSGDFSLVNGMGWNSADRALFRVLPAAKSCLQELASYASPLGKLWFYERPGHTAGSIDLVLDVQNDPGNRIVVRGSQPSAPCTAISGQREIINAHGNVELFSARPGLTDVAPLQGTSLGGTTLTLTGAGFTAAGAGTPRVYLGGALASEVSVLGDTSLTCKVPAGPAGQLVEVTVVNNNGKAELAGAFFYTALPSLTTISPVSGDWRGGTLVQVRGAGFLLSSGSNEVFFGSKRASNILVRSDTLITCRTPSGTQGTLVAVTLRNPDGEVTLEDAYRYSADVAISSVVPTSGTALGGASVVLTGLAFNASGAVPTLTFGGVAASDVVLLSDTSVSAVAPPGTPGTSVDVVLTNSVGSATYSAYRYHATPAITGLAPASGALGGGTRVTLAGAGFLADSAGPNQIRFGGIPATQVTLLADDSLTCLTPPGTPGAVVNVTLSNANGTATLPFAFTYSQPLSASALRPASGSSEGGTLVTLEGTGFLNGGTNRVRFGGLEATGVSVIDDATLTCLSPAGAPLALVALEVANELGSVTLPAAFRYHAQPSLSSISPNHGHAGAFTPVMLSGTGFLADDAGFGFVVVGGTTAKEVEVLSDTTLTCIVPPGTPGASVDLILVNQNGTATLAGGFRYHAAPSVSAVTPASGAATSQLRVTLSGSGFASEGAGVPSVTIGGIAATSISVLGDQSLRCNVPIGTPGQSADVVVTNARGTGTLSGGYRFHARPSLGGATPARGPFLGGTRVTLTGSGFQRDAAGNVVVSFGGALATGIVVSSDTSLVCTAPPGTLGTAVDIVLSNANGTATLAQGFTYTLAGPTLTSLTPGSGPAHAPGTVQLGGSGFLAESAGTNTVRFGPAAASGVSVIDDARLTCLVPPGAPGTSVDVSLENANGSAQLVQSFRYHARPSLSALVPAAASAAGGASIQILGSGFLADAAGTNTVRFGGVPALNVTVLDDATLSCVVPPGTPGALLEVRVGNANGESGPGSFAFHPPPSLSVVAPDVGPLVGEARVTLTGSGFLEREAGTNSVFFGERAAVDVLVLSDTRLSCTTPRGTTGYVDVLLSNANGSSLLPASYHYGKLPPQVIGLESSSGPSGGRNLVSVRGRGFLSAGAGTNRVKFGAILSDNVVTVDDTTILCAAPPGTPGALVDVAVNNTGGTGTLPASYRYHSPPRLLSVTPPEGAPLSATRVTLAGAGFLLDSPGENVVLFGTVAAREVQVHDDGRLSCRVVGGSPGSVLDVTVRNANGSATLPGAYRVTGGPPAVHGVFPDHGSFLGGTAVRIEGRGFSAAPVRVTFGGVEALDLIVDGDAQLRCVTPPGESGKSVTISIRTASGSAAVLEGFTYEAVRPRLLALAPSSGPASGGTRMTLTGSSFQAPGAGTPSVRFGGVAATNVSVLSDTSLTCDAPAGVAEAVVGVELSNANGKSVLQSSFRYHAAPRLSALTPTSGAPGGGTSVTLSGQGFLLDAAGPNLVRFGARSALDVVVQSDTSLTCTTPRGTPGALTNVTLSNQNGQAVLVGAFRYQQGPVLSTVTPARGALTGGTALTLHGSGFLDAGGCTVTLGGLAALDVVTVSDTTLTCSTPPGAAAAAVDVVVSNANGSSTAPAAFTYFVAPTLTALAPQRGPSAGGTAVTLSGSGFLAAGHGATVVRFGAGFALDVLVLSDSQVRCTTPPGDPGASVDVRLANQNGQSTLAAGFRYHVPPTINTLHPVSGSSVSSTAVTISGTGFLADEAGSNSVFFGAEAATGVVALSDAVLTCVVGPQQAGSVVAITVVNQNGTGSLDAAFGFDAPPPTLVSLDPTRGVSLGGTRVTLTGAGFTDGISVGFGAHSASDVLVLDANTLECTTPPGPIGADVLVSVANAHGLASLPGAFHYFAPQPTLSALSSSSGRAAGGATLTLTGTGFLANGAGPNGVGFGALAATDVSVLSDTSLTCTVPAGAAGSAVDVTLSNANGTAVLSSGYRYHAVPTLTSLTPASGTSLGGTLITVRGSGFLRDAPGANSVLFGATPATAVIVLDDTRLTCRAPSGAGGSSVTVSLSNQNGAAQLVSAYRYHVRPTLGAVTPASGPAAGGERVTLTGTGFQVDGAVVNIVSFGGVAATGVSVLSNTSLQCNVPPGPSGLSVQVAVANVNGTALLPAGYRYHARPTLASIAPAGGPFEGGTRVTLSGSGFSIDAPGPNGVSFGGVPASALTVLSDTQLTCVAPPGAAGALVDVVLSNANGNATLFGAFTYASDPLLILSAVTPSKGSTEGSTLVTLTGIGFRPGMGVEFGAQAASEVNVLNTNTLTCRTPSRADGAWVDVRVHGAASTRLPLAFQFVPPPTLLAIEPPFGPPAGGALVVLTGSGFQQDGGGEPRVTFGGAPALSVSVLDDQHLACEVPAGPALSAVDVVVANEIASARLDDGYRWQHAHATDLDHDGRGDLILFAPGGDAYATDAGTVHVFLGASLPFAKSSLEDDITAVPDRASLDFGSPVAAGDLDGDGRAELLIAATGDDRGGREAGAVFIYRGPLTRSPLELPCAAADLELTGSLPGERFGSALLLLDFDRNGMLDVLVGAPGRTGAAHLFLGSTTGLATTAALVLRGQAGNEDFATSLAAGDLDGDGWLDLVVGAPNARRASTTMRTGDVRVYRGGPSALLTNDPAPWMVFTGIQDGDTFGSAIACGDLDNDGIDDLIVGAAEHAGTGAEAGAVFVFFGGSQIAGRSASLASLTLTPEGAGGRFGHALALGDTNGDGRAELVVGAPNHAGAGRAYVFLGGAGFARTQAAQADHVLDGEAGSLGEFASSVALVDVNGDGLDDFVASAPGFDSFGSNLGRVYVFGAPLTESRSATDADGTLTGSVAGDQLGHGLAQDL